MDVARKEIQSLDVSCFIQATEDEARVVDSVRGGLKMGLEPAEDILEGHFGNAIVHVRWHLTGEEAWATFQALLSILGREGREELMTNLSSHLDERGALYLRLDKQALVGGAAVLSYADPVRIRVKPRGFLMRGQQPDVFYRRLIGSISI